MFKPSFLLLAAALLWPLAAPSLAFAQRRPIHYLQRADEPPGVIGSRQLLRGGPLPGYFQPVEIIVPEGASVSLAEVSDFAKPCERSARVGLLIGKVYRVKVTGIPRREGEELFPTIEIINRLYPPPGCEVQFPIPIDLALEDLEMALAGSFVTRVIYLEDPEDAFPIVQDPQRTRYIDAFPNDDPLEVADRLGRPMAIVRIGSRQPDSETPSADFLYGAPPFQWLPKPPPGPNPSVHPIVEGRDIPRVPGHGAEYAPQHPPLGAPLR